MLGKFFGPYQYAKSSPDGNTTPNKNPQICVF